MDSEQEVIVIGDSDDSPVKKEKEGDDPLRDSHEEKVQSPSPFLTLVANGSKRIHMDLKDCKDHSETQSGAKPLTDPSTMSKSSRDPNRGLYPRPSRKRGSSSSGAFVSASSLLNPRLPFVPASTSAHNQATSPNRALQSQQFDSSPRKRPRVGRSKLPAQSNSLDRYFSASQPNSSSGDGSDESSIPSKKLFCSQGSSELPPLPKSPPSFMSSATRPEGGVERSMSPNGKSKTEAKAPERLFVKKKTDSKRTKKSRKEPKFKRDNTFLYSQGQTAAIPAQSKASNNNEKDLYGLLGNGNRLPDEAESGTQISELPFEILENILCRLPLMDLCLNVNRVCKDWKDIISDEKVGEVWNFQQQLNVSGW